MTSLSRVTPHNRKKMTFLVVQPIALHKIYISILGIRIAAQKEITISRTLGS